VGSGAGRAHGDLSFRRPWTQGRRDAGFFIGGALWLTAKLLDTDRQSKK
jgi:hypothetical protein